ncbi:TetR family transcriptional regulator [Niveispirillum sp. SYP-B3756]|uniref:TetR/AcrR family transcriptional regulator n=1 Tax=Niveispirillum sp. SYP-B3756 TaxID=2662178 RepID=UPI0012921C00|nr:TetR/AcrR family transcriptional regulator [Niveispirillum sp. SYP-B3756]MQP67495.1 TetR family transcriptional regulator [Niveispirillum sp. SYP-B3756]
MVLPPLPSPNDSGPDSERLSPRAQATRLRLMQAGAELLGEVGIERISTNLVAARAGVTPPIFYRHFKDKYELLAALGEDLMIRQNRVLETWLAQHGGGYEKLIEAHYDFLLDSIRVTAEVPGAVWIMRALRAVPSLANVRLDSHEWVTDRIMEAIQPLLPQADPVELRLRSRIAVEAGYSVIELALEDAHQSPEALCRGLTRMWVGGLRNAL